MGYPAAIRIVEVGPRDGLQNEATPIPTALKADFIRALTQSGLTDIEVTSFVHPERVPQLADAQDLLTTLGPPPAGVCYSALVPNQRGLARALASGIKRIAVFGAASETFVQRNIGMDIETSIKTFEPVVKDALAAGLSVRGYLSTVLWCPYEGRITPEPVVALTERLLAMGVDEISLGDTIGKGVPKEVEALLSALQKAGLPFEKLALHCHNTYGTALVNVMTAMQAGITVFDSSAGGLGGCPYAPGAAGNLSTEDLVFFCDGMGVSTGVNRDALQAASAMIQDFLKNQPSGECSRP